VQFGAAAILRRKGDPPDGPVVVLPLAFMLTVMMTLLMVPGNQLSRQIELRTDYDAIAVTGDPDAMIRLQRRIAESNLSDPDPPAAWQKVFGTHPSALDRIGLALAIREQG
jgi:STE24 endopeptidase